MQRVLDAAGRHFMAHGFERTSLDAIAKDADVSRVTIYSYFPSKESLFEEVVRSRVVGYLEGDLFNGLPTAEPREALRRIGIRFVGLMRDDGVVRLHRTLFAEAERHSHLGRLFFQEGPARLVRGVAAFLEACDRAGTLRVPDPLLAADQFLSLFLGSGHIRSLLGFEQPSADEDAERLEANLGVFLAAFATRTVTDATSVGRHRSGARRTSR